MIIDEFRGEYDFLSNFYSCPVTYNGESYLNSEDTGSRNSGGHLKILNGLTRALELCMKC